MYSSATSSVGNDLSETIINPLEESTKELSSLNYSTNNQNSTSIGFSNNYSPSLITELTPYFSIISVCLVIIGWVVLYQNAKKLATRNETKSLIDDTVSIVSQLENLAASYWLSGRKNRVDTEEYILLTSAKLEMLNGRLNIIKNRGVAIRSLDLANISEFMTLNCEEVDRRKPESNREQLQLLLEELNIGVSGLYKSFEECYSPSKPFL